MLGFEGDLCEIPPCLGNGVFSAARAIAGYDACTCFAVRQRCACLRARHHSALTHAARAAAVHGLQLQRGVRRQRRGAARRRLQVQHRPRRRRLQPHMPRLRAARPLHHHRHASEWLLPRHRRGHLHLRARLVRCQRNMPRCDLRCCSRSHRLPRSGANCTLACPCYRGAGAAGGNGTCAVSSDQLSATCNCAAGWAGDDCSVACPRCISPGGRRVRARCCTMHLSRAELICRH